MSRNYKFADPEGLYFASFAKPEKTRTGAFAGLVANTLGVLL